MNPWTYWAGCVSQALGLSGPGWEDLWPCSRLQKVHRQSYRSHASVQRQTKTEGFGRKRYERDTGHALIAIHTPHCGQRDWFNWTKRGWVVIHAGCTHKDSYLYYRAATLRLSFLFISLVFLFLFPSKGDETDPRWG